MYWVISLACVIASGEMWRLGGDGQSLYRNPLVPFIIAISKAVLIHSWWALLYVPLMWGAIQAFSYGLDSPIHKIWARIFGCGEQGNVPVVEVATRATCGLLWSTPAILFAVLTGNWLAYILYAFILTVVNGMVGGLVEDVEVSERVVGGVVGMGGMI